MSISLPPPPSYYPISLPELEVTDHSRSVEHMTQRLPEKVVLRADLLPGSNYFKRTACFWHYMLKLRILTFLPPKPKCLAWIVEIWHFQCSYVQKLKNWKTLGVPNWCPLWIIWPRKMYILMLQEVGLQNEVWIRAKKASTICQTVDEIWEFAAQSFFLKVICSCHDTSLKL